MTRELRRLLITPERLAAARIDGSGFLQVPMEPPEAHYVGRVLRCRIGDRLGVVDGRGHLWSVRLERGNLLRWEQPLHQPLEQQEPPSPTLELAMAIPRREADLVWRMATELGADRLQPLIAHRCAPGERHPKSRWHGIVREATEQCERLWLPTLENPAPAATWLQAPGRGLALLATTRREGLPLCAELIQELGGSSWAGPGPAAIHLAVGPEGGWTPEEESQASAAGWRLVSLGTTILRTSTAAVSALATLSAWRALSCASSPRPSP